MRLQLVSNRLGSTLQNNVLKNTYLLLSLSMIPTILGAWFGVETQIMQSLGTIVTLVIFFAGAFGLMYLIEKNKNSQLGVFLLLGFTFFMGVMLSGIISQTLGYKNGGNLILMAFGGTATILMGMSFLTTIIKTNLSFLGKFLFVGVMMLIIGSLANIYFQSPIFMIVLSVISIGIFSAYLLYDIQKIINGGETNYIVATLGIYLSLFNIFQNLLALLGIFGGED